MGLLFRSSQTKENHKSNVESYIVIKNAVNEKLDVHSYLQGKNDSLLKNPELFEAVQQFSTLEDLKKAYRQSSVSPEQAYVFVVKGSVSDAKKSALEGKFSQTILRAFDLYYFRYNVQKNIYRETTAETPVTSINESHLTQGSSLLPVHGT